MIFSTPREFTPATKETGLSDASPLWFIFKKNELLVLQKDASDGLEIPNLKDPSELGINIGSQQLIGHSHSYTKLL